MSNEAPVEVYVDELGGIMLGHPVTKLTFISLRQDELDKTNNVPPRATQVLTLAISTQTLI